VSSRAGTELLLLTPRLPQLETPMRYFDRTIIPTEAFLIRYDSSRADERRPMDPAILRDRARNQAAGAVTRPPELTPAAGSAPPHSGQGLQRRRHECLYAPLAVSSVDNKRIRRGSND